jgi:bifunctional non-homologous end joining protein LigD
MLIARPFHRDGWVYEEKYDGWRMVVYKDRGVVRLVSRNGRDLRRRFPGLVNAVGALPASTLILDGEVAVFEGEVDGHRLKPHYRRASAGGSQKR